MKKNCSNLPYKFQLIKSVLTTMPIHALAAIYPTKSVLSKLKGMFSRFLWGSSEVLSKLGSQWYQVCKPMSEGGPSIRRLEDICNAMSVKLWWKFSTSNSLWASFIKARYCNKNHPLEVNPKNFPNIWGRLCKVRDLVECNIKWRLGSGKIDLIRDHWMENGPIYSFCDSQSVGPVVEYWTNNNNGVKINYCKCFLFRL